MTEQATEAAPVLANLRKTLVQVAIVFPVSTESHSDIDAARLAVELAVAISRLRARMREEADEASHGITVSQFAMLRRLADRGPMSAAQLAATEHVTQQAIAQRLDLLRPTGYVAVTPDPADRRRKLVSITDTGRSLLDTVSATGEHWLARAIVATVSENELSVVEKAVDLLERLATVDLRPTALLR